MLKYHLTKQARERGCEFTQPQHDGDAGYDICSLDDCTVFARSTRLISTGLYLRIPYGYVGLLKDRSGFASRNSAHILAGVIDSSYRGEVRVLMANLSNTSIRIRAGDRIAQIVIVPVFNEAVYSVSRDALIMTTRGEDGFGSTGI